MCTDFSLWDISLLFVVKAACVALISQRLRRSVAAAKTSAPAPAAAAEDRGASLH